LLYDLGDFHNTLAHREGRRLPEPVVAYRGLTEIFEPTIAAIPDELRGKLEPAEIYHQLLDHRWYLSEAAGRDVGLADAMRSYVDTVLRFVPDEKELLSEETGELPVIPNSSSGVDQRGD
jgi:hypothetical protein